MFNLEGKTALVTGATGGIGEAIAKSLQAQGARVALTGRKADVLESLAKEMGGDTQFFPCDLGEDGADFDYHTHEGSNMYGALEISNPLSVILKSESSTRFL